MNIVLPIYCNSVLNNLHFFGDILSPFYSNAFSRSSNFDMCNSIEEVNNRRSSKLPHNIVYFANSLVLHLYNIAKLKVIYLIHEAFFDINKKCYQSMEVSHNFSLSFPIILMNGMHLFKSNTDSTSHLEIPYTHNVSLIKGYDN